MMRAVDPATARSKLKSLPRSCRHTLLLLLRGCSEKELAGRLFISPHTAHTHVKTIYRRLGVTSRAQLLSALLVPSPAIFGDAPEKELGIEADAGHNLNGPGTSR